MKAPHLPPKTNSIAWRARVVFAKTVLLTLIIALAAGATAALVVLVWYPQIIGYETPVSAYSYVRVDPSPRAPEDLLARAASISDATLRVFRASDTARFGLVRWYARDAAVGSAVLLTQDGWALTSNDVTSASTDLRVADHRGELYEIEQQITDSRSGLTFFKISGDSFSSVPLSERSTTVETVYYMQQGQLRGFDVGALSYNRSEPLLSDRLQRFRRVEVGYELSAGTPLFDHEGVLTGIAARRSAEMIIVPISAIRSLLPDVFSQEAVPTDALRIQYLMMPDVLPLNLADDPQAPQRGAYIVSVERLSSGAVLPSLERGDIIIAVNEQPLTSSEDLSLAFAKFRPQKEALLTVYRDAQQIRVPVVLSVAQ